MPQIGWTELLLLAVVAILVIGPKDLPYFLKSIGKYYNKMRSIARDFQRSINEVTKETGVDDIKKDISSITKDSTADIFQPNKSEVSATEEKVKQEKKAKSQTEKSEI